MQDFDEVTNEIVKFRDERDWQQFHNPKDLSIAIGIEAAELNELFLWKQADEANPEKVKEELADILTFSFLLAHHYQLDIPQIIKDKIEINRKKYPVDKSRGNAKKYDEL